MKFLELVNRVICIICAGLGAFSLGYAVVTDKNHCYFTAVVLFLIAFLIMVGERSDRKREEEERQKNWRD